jgi:nitroreductase
MMVAAWGDGVGSCPAPLPEPEVAKLLAIPAALYVNRVIAFGYVDPDRAAAPVSVSRTRKPLTELVHWETW